MAVFPMKKARSISTHQRRGARGFTLVEAAFVTVVVGLSCAALMQLLAAGTVANIDAAEITSGMNLGNNLHEATLPMTFAQILSLDGKNYSPPVDSQFNSLSTLGSTWKQHVDVKYVDPNNLSNLSGTTVEDTARVTVIVYHNNNAVYSTYWIVANVP